MKKKDNTIEARLERTGIPMWIRSLRMPSGEIQIVELQKFINKLLTEQRHSIISMLSDRKTKDEIFGVEIHENPFLKEGEWGLLPNYHKVDINTTPKHSWRNEFDQLIEEKNINYIAVVPLFNFIQDLLIKQKQRIILNIKAWHFNEFSPDTSCLNDCPKKIIDIINKYKI